MLFPKSSVQMNDIWHTIGLRGTASNEYVIKDLFVPHFYFGCEADDPVTAWAFDTKKNPYGAKLNAIFSSDIGHWDVVDMRGVTAEAYELIEHGLLNEDEFRDFMFSNAARMWGSTNPDFFRGTVVEREAAKVLGS